LTSLFFIIFYPELFRLEVYNNKGKKTISGRPPGRKVGIRVEAFILGVKNLYLTRKEDRFILLMKMVFIIIKRQKDGWSS